MPRGNHWYSNLETTDPEKKNELSKYMKMYRVIKSEIRQLTAELALNTANPTESKHCYRALHRIFNQKSLTRSKEAARLMLALGDPDLLRALQRRYPKQISSAPSLIGAGLQYHWRQQLHETPQSIQANILHFEGSSPIPGPTRVHQTRGESDVNKTRGIPVGHMEISGDVIHTVFSEARGNKANLQSKDKLMRTSTDLIGNKHGMQIIDKVSKKSTKKQTCILLCGNSPLFNNREPNSFPQQKSLLNSKAGNINSSVDEPPLKKICKRHDQASVLEKASRVEPLCSLTGLCASSVPKHPDQTTPALSIKHYSRPSSGPAILMSGGNPDQKKRIFQLRSLHDRPGAIRLGGGRVSIPASLCSTTLIKRVNSSNEVRSTNSDLSMRKKSVSKGMRDPTISSDDAEFELSPGVFEDLYVVKQHRRSCFSDGDSLVEVRPRSMPTAPTLFATQTSEGMLNVPTDIESNRRAILVINAMKNTLYTQ